MLVGSFGAIVFEVSQLKVLTFDNYKRKTTAKYASHEIIGRPAVLEFTARELEEVSLTVKVIAALGATPEEVALQLRDYCQKGEPGFIIIGGVVIGENQFVLTDVSESVEIWHGAAIYVNQLDLNFKEYVARGD